MFNGLLASEYYPLEKNRAVLTNAWRLFGNYLEKRAMGAGGTHPLWNSVENGGEKDSAKLWCLLRAALQEDPEHAVSKTSAAVYLKAIPWSRCSVQKTLQTCSARRSMDDFSCEDEPKTSSSEDWVFTMLGLPSETDRVSEATPALYTEAQVDGIPRRTLSGNNSKATDFVPFLPLQDVASRAGETVHTFVTHVFRVPGKGRGRSFSGKVFPDVPGVTNLVVGEDPQAFQQELQDLVGHIFSHEDHVVSGGAVFSRCKCCFRSRRSWPNRSCERFFWEGPPLPKT